MNLQRSKQILLDRNDYTDFQVKLALDCLTNEVTRLQESVKQYKRIVEHQEIICKEYVESIRPKNGYVMFFQPETMKRFVRDLSYNTVLSEKVILDLARALANRGEPDSQIKDKLTIASKHWGKV